MSEKTNALVATILLLALFVSAQQVAVNVTLPTEDGLFLTIAQYLVTFLTLTPVAIAGALLRNVLGYLYNYWDESESFNDKRLYTTFVKFEGGVLMVLPIIQAFAPSIPNIALVSTAIVFVADVVASVAKRLWRAPASTAS